MLIHDFTCPKCKKSQIFGFNQEEINQGGKKTICRSRSCKGYFLWIPLASQNITLFLRSLVLPEIVKGVGAFKENDIFIKEIVCLECKMSQYSLFEEKDIPHGGIVWRCQNPKCVLLWVPLVGPVMKYVSWARKNKQKKK